MTGLAARAFVAHANGLLHRPIKVPDGTEIVLRTQLGLSADSLLG